MDEPTLYLERDMQAPEVLAIAGGRAIVFSTRCPDKATPNEDAAALVPFDEESCVLVVADGVGGVPGGAQASGVAVSSLSSAVVDARRSGRVLRSAILNGIENADAAVRALGVETTLVVAEIQGDSMRTYHVGDSMILVVGQRGRVKFQSVSHSPTGFAVEAGLLNERAALHHEDRHLVSNVLGAPDMRVEMGTPRHLAPRDTLLLASDGLFDNLHTSEIVERIRKGPLQRGAERLVKLSQRRMQDPHTDQPSKPDDLTFVGFRRGGG